MRNEAPKLPFGAVAAIAAPEISAPQPTKDATNRKNMVLLIQLRWIAVVGQIVTIAFVTFWFGIVLPLGPMAAIICALVALNVGSHIWLRRRDDVGNRHLLIALMLDVVALTSELYLTGGASNPFTCLYLLQVTLGAVLLDARSSWSLVALTVLSFIWLTIEYRPLELPHQHGTDPFTLHITGMFVGFVLDAVLLVVFVTRINRNLRERDAKLADLRQHAADHGVQPRQRGVGRVRAHELGTPLASISVILNDWRRMTAIAADPALAEDFTEMEAAVQRCKAIVTDILVSAGQARGEGSAPTTLKAFLTALVAEWSAARSARGLMFRNEFGADPAIVSDVALKQAIVNVLDNAFEVSRDWVEFVVERDGDMLLLTISDRGPGFDAAILAQLGRPYQSSKGRPGRGLGLFLVVNVIRKLGGGVSAWNHRGRGATVRLSLPLSTLVIGEQVGG